MPESARNATRRRHEIAVRGRIWCVLLLAGAASLPVHAEETPVDERVHVFEVVVGGEPQAVLSFLPPDHVFANGLAADAIIGSMKTPVAAGGGVTPDNVAVNPGFVAFLHAFIARTVPTDPGFQRAVADQQDGWVYIIDRRTPTPGGKVPAEDILGGFEVRQKALVPDSYRPIRAHRIVSERGVVRLDDFLHPRLVEALKQLEAPQGRR